jgi:hypothetical protein
MCGGHGIHHLLSLVAPDTTESRDANHRAGGSRSLAVMEQQVKLMYARGEIGVEAFHRLRDMAQAGTLKPAELAVFQSHPANIREVSLEDRPQPSESSFAYLHQLRQRRNELEAACIETEESIRRLQLEAAQLYHSAEFVGSDVQQVASDPEKINMLLEIKERTLSRARSIEGRIEHSVERLAHLRAQLDEAVAEERTFSPP